MEKLRNQGYLGNLTKLPPQNLEVEQALLGAAILFQASRTTILERLIVDDFYTEQNQEVFQALIELDQDRISIDIRSVAEKVKKRGNNKLFEFGAAYYIAELSSRVSSSGDMSYLCAILVEKRMLRQMISLALDITTKAYEDETDAFDLLKVITKFPEGILDKMKATSEKTLGDHLTELVQDIAKRAEEGIEKTIGIPTGYPNLDSAIGGLREPRLIIIGARPGMGKTTLALNIARNCAVDFSKPGAFFSLEMSGKELVAKLAAIESGIPQEKIDGKVFESIDWERFNATTTHLFKAKVWIDDCAHLTLSDLRNKLRRLKGKYGIEWAMIDYLQLMKGDSFSRGNREQEIATISRGLKSLCKELQIPIVALCQLSREVEKRQDKRPQLADLRESGAIEQDSDTIMFLWRPGYYHIIGDSGGNFSLGATMCDIAKHRHGPTGQVWFTFEMDRSKFYSLEDPYAQISSGTETVHEERARKSKAFYERKSQTALEYTDDIPF